MNVVVSNMEISCSKHHPIPGETGVAGGEAEACLLYPDVDLSGGVEQLGVSLTRPVSHVLRTAP